MMRIKFEIFAVAAVILIFSQTLSGDDGGAAFRACIAGHRADITVSWRAEASGKTYAGDGELSWKDGRFRFTNDEVQIYNDGVSLVSVSQLGKEVVIQPSDSTDFLSDPAALATMLGLKPAKSGVVIHYSSGGNISGADITLKNGTSVTVKVVKLSVSDSSDDGDFRFDVDSLDSSWVVTDLR